MRKKSIVEDFRNKEYPGSLIMDKTNNFMNSVLMDIDDEIRISYFFTEDQLNINSSLLQVYANVNYDKLKRDSIELKINDKQSDFDNDKNTSWIFTFDANALLRQYLYNEIYTLNPNSSFREIPSNIVSTDELGDLCYDYIDKNILDRYELKDFILWTKYYDLSLNKVPGSGTGSGIVGQINPTINLLYKKPEFTFKAIPDTNQDDNKEPITIKEDQDNKYLIGYKQKESSQFKTFIYYYDVIFRKK